MLPLALGLLGLAGAGRYLGNKYNDYSSGQDAEKLKGLLGTQAQPYQMSEAEMFPGEQPIQGLYSKGTGLLSDVTDPEIVKQAQVYKGLLDIPQYQEAGVRGLLSMMAPAESPYTNIQVDASGQPWGMNRKTGQFGPVPTGGGTFAQKPYTDIGELEADRRSGRITQEQYDYMKELMTKKGLASSQPYFTPVQTSSGIFSYDNRTGRAIPLFGDQGAPLLPIAIDPNAQAAVTGAKKEAEIRSKATTEAAVDLPKTIASGEQTLKIIDELLRHPGRTIATGASGVIDPRNYIAGTQARDFQVRLDQLKGKAFLEAYSMLKGGGQITEIEGQKAENAMARLDRAQSDEEYVQALMDMQDVIKNGMERAKTMAGRGGQVRQQSAPSGPTTQAPVRRYNPATGRFE